MASKPKKSAVPSNSVVCTPIGSKQPNILSMFSAASAATVTVKKTTTTTTVAAAAPVAPASDLTSDDPIVAAFYKSLSPAEMIAHRIATVKLGTSYDVTRTRGFLAWSKTRAASGAT